MNGTRECALALAMLLAAPLAAQDAGGPPAIGFRQLGDPPVTAGDIADRPYDVIGPISTGVRKATLFSASSSQEKIYRELWERGRKMGADAVIHASYGKSHITALSWGSTSATGLAIRFRR